MSLQDKIVEQFVKTVDFGKLAGQALEKFKPADLVSALAVALAEHAEEAAEELNKDYDGDGVKNSDELLHCAAQLEECAGILARVYGEVSNESK